MKNKYSLVFLLCYFLFQNIVTIHSQVVLPDGSISPDTRIDEQIRNLPTRNINDVIKKIEDGIITIEKKENETIGCGGTISSEDLIFCRLPIRDIQPVTFETQIVSSGIEGEEISIKCCRCTTFYIDGVKQKNEEEDNILINEKEDKSILNKVKYFPNPATTSVTLQLQESISEIMIIQSDGKVVRRFENVGAGEMQVDLSGFSEGFYLIRFRKENGVANGKLIVIKP